MNPLWMSRNWATAHNFLLPPRRANFFHYIALSRGGWSECSKRAIWTI